MQQETSLSREFLMSSTDFEPILPIETSTRSPRTSCKEITKFHKRLTTITKDEEISLSDSVKVKAQYTTAGAEDDLEILKKRKFD